MLGSCDRVERDDDYDDDDEAWVRKKTHFGVVRCSAVIVMASKKHAMLCHASDHARPNRRLTRKMVRRDDYHHASNSSSNNSSSIHQYTLDHHLETVSGW
ncbi:hypothetical protein M0802_013596 [Mischocyttarus mexicanus]|nr:hypothetical protein M0802_013596 [Mischocyttarus mexicanus]